MPKMKYLWAAALVALCVTLGPGLALAADSWALVDQTFPTAITWDGSAAVSVDTNNDGDTTWDSTYGLASVEGVTAAATKIDRWGLTDVPVSGTVAPAADYTFDFSIIGPPITTLAYTVPVGPTAAGVITGLDCNWMLANTGALITTDTAENSIVVSRFPDEGGAWNYYIEELAGRGPFIVSGFGDGTYRPTADVLRNSMAVYMARALKLDLLPYAGVFPDVVEGSFGALEIEALVRTGIVTGYADGYRPTAVVNRGQMAAYVARGIAGGDEFVPSGPATQTFDDVAPDFGFYKYIEYAVAQGVVTGYAVDNTYRPANAVNRGQMSAFVWRSFMRVDGTPVVLAGPAVSANDPLTTDWIGWTSPPVLGLADPGFAYVGLDAVRLNTNLVGPDDSFDVTFVLYDPDGVTEASHVISLDAAAITAAHDAAMASGDPYLFMSWGLPAVDPAGEYSLKVFVTDENDDTWQAGRTASLYIGISPPITATWGYDEALALLGGAVDDSTASAGYPESAMAKSDDVYFRSQRNTFPDTNDDWCNWNHSHALVWHGVPSTASSMTITFEYRIENIDGEWGDCCDTSCCGEGWGDLGTWDLPSPPDPDPLYTMPYGWGLRVMSGADGGNWQTQWYDTDEDPEDVYTLVGSGDPDLPADNDVMGGGTAFVHTGFTGHPTTDSVYQWGTADVASYVTGDYVMLVVCGGSMEYVYVDQATLQYVP